MIIAKILFRRSFIGDGIDMESFLKTWWCSDFYDFYGTEPEMISFGDNVHVASGVTFINHDIWGFMLRYMKAETSCHVRTEN